LQDSEGLRHIADDVLCEAFQEELGLTSNSAAQLSRKHDQVYPELLQQMLERIVKRILPHTEPQLTAIRRKQTLMDGFPWLCCVELLSQRNSSHGL
jgi:hypothetical protein